MGVQACVCVFVCEGISEEWRAGDWLQVCQQATHQGIPPLPNRFLCGKH